MRYSTIFFLFLTALHAEEFNYGVFNKHAFTMPEGNFAIKSSYLKVNDTLDVFNIKESELGSLSRFGSIGDMDGYTLELRYGLTDDDSIFFDYQRWNIDYAGSTLANNKIELFNRYNIVHDDYAIFNGLAIDVGFINNFAQPLDVTNETLLNSMIKKIKPSSNISIKDGSIVSGDTTFSIYDGNNKKISPYLSIQDLDSKSYYLRVLLAKTISPRNVIDFYTAVKYTDITTNIVLKPSNNSLLNQYIANYDIPDLNRDEMVYSLGLNTATQFSDYIFEFNYEYNRIVRDSHLNAANTSNTIEATFSRIVDKNLILFVGGKILFEQFNTDIPYLYNQYTQTQFDKKYGFAQIGLVYNFEGLK